MLTYCSPICTRHLFYRFNIHNCKLALYLRSIEVDVNMNSSTVENSRYAEIDHQIILLEIARDYFIENGTHQVIGGIISPANDSYNKPGLIASTHRCAMIKGTLQTSDWIRLSDWECKQDNWTRTRISLQYHQVKIFLINLAHCDFTVNTTFYQNYANSYINDINGTVNEVVPSWLPDNIKDVNGNVQVKLLCGADLLESFSVPGLWAQEDVMHIALLFTISK